MKTTKRKTISLLLVISGILVLIVGIGMVQTGFASFDDTEPRVGLYIGGIFSIIGGIFLTIAGTVFLYFDFLKKKVIRTLGKVSDAVEEERKREKM
ncbi:MAG TPA: hypothetical protein EYQ05_07080 [Gammaproteobacteria bacterium]|nr:hypothetical protein [Gammaproteobacteria bacterium]